MDRLAWHLIHRNTYAKLVSCRADDVASQMERHSQHKSETLLQYLHIWCGQPLFPFYMTFSSPQTSLFFQYPLLFLSFNMLLILFSPYTIFYLPIANHFFVSLLPHFNNCHTNPGWTFVDFWSHLNQWSFYHIFFSFDTLFSFLFSHFITLPYLPSDLSSIFVLIFASLYALFFFT